METRDHQVQKDHAKEPNMGNDNTTAAAASASASRKTASRSLSPRLTRAATTPVISTIYNLTVSPLASRETSPIRPTQPTAKFSTARVSRSRKNSTDQSPQRTPSLTPTTAQTVPSAAAVQRALAAVGDKKLASPTAPQFSADALEPRKSARGTTPGVPAHRLTSPPSVARSKTSGTRTPESPAGGNPNASKSTSAIETIQEEDDDETAATKLKFSPRPTIGSTLETVQEDRSSQAAGMSESLLAAQRPSTIQEDPDEDNVDMTSSQTTSGTKSSTTTGGTASGSDDESNSKKKGREQAKGKEPDKLQETPKSATQSATASRKPSITQLAPLKPPSIQPRKSFQHLNPARNKEGSVKSMTVETETVSNPDLLGPDREGRGASGSVRAKASSETIRPKREKKRARKPPSIASATVSRTYTHSPSPLVLLSCIVNTAVAASEIANMPPPSLQFTFNVQVTGESLRSPCSTYDHKSWRSRPTCGSASSSRAFTSPRTLIPEPLRSPWLTTNSTASTKADIFEAKVASAVDEAANSSDSEETFVYESNPPEPRSSRRGHHGQRYHHSRTPSAASMASQSTDNYRSNHFGISGKKSMKFVNTNQLRDADDEDAGCYASNTVRSSRRPHDPVARLARLQNQPNESVSPISSTRATRVRNFNSWRTHGNRQLQDSETLVSAMADKSQNTSMYDLSNAAEADDEFTPLLVARSGRNDPRLRRGRLLRADSYRQSPWRSFVSCAKYTCMSSLVGAVIALVILTLVICNRDLTVVHDVKIRNVLVSEQELFLEVEVTARNPNLVDISIAEGDLELFAKSKYVGTTEMWRNGTIPGLKRAHHNRTAIAGFSPNDNVDDGTDPIEEPGAGTHTMLLGSISELDSPLVYESSPLSHQLHHSRAQMRLTKPGNKTEEGGSQRWENVMQHPFELVLRGSLIYYLPLSNQARRKDIGSSTTVTPDKPIDDDPKSNDTVKISATQTRGEIKLKRHWWA